ncbi:unnamed protein product, partial [Prorocentrum cordatum]
MTCVDASMLCAVESAPERWCCAWCGCKRDIDTCNACRHLGDWKTAAPTADAAAVLAGSTGRRSRPPVARGAAGASDANGGGHPDAGAEHDRGLSEREFQHFVTLAEKAGDPIAATQHRQKLDAVRNTTEPSLQVKVTTQGAKVTELEAAPQDVVEGKSDLMSSIDVGTFNADAYEVSAAVKEAIRTRKDELCTQLEELATCLFSGAADKFQGLKKEQLEHLQRLGKKK